VLPSFVESLEAMRIAVLFPLLMGPVVLAQNAIEAFPGTPALDGVMSPGEWDLAPVISIGTAPGDTCRVAVMTDFAAVYFAFMGHLESNNALFPEVLLDAQHDRTAAWNADDHWFHVSATDCHHQGAYGVYDDCLLVQPDWTGIPNITPGTPITDTVEIAVPWSKLGLATPSEGDSLGLCLLVTNTASSWRLWPNGSQRLAPDTWGHLVVPFWNSVADVPASGLLRVWPSPADQELHLVPGSSAQVNGRMRLVDLQGRVVVDRQLAFPAVLPTHDLQAATYVCIVTLADGRQLARRVSIVH
jgi:hypothetical protein